MLLLLTGSSANRYYFFPVEDHRILVFVSEKTRMYSGAFSFQPSTRIANKYVEAA